MVLDGFRSIGRGTGHHAQALGGQRGKFASVASLGVQPRLDGHVIRGW
jgi:hypothetical protein